MTLRFLKTQLLQYHHRDYIDEVFKSIMEYDSDNDDKEHLESAKDLEELSHILHYGTDDEVRFMNNICRFIKASEEVATIIEVRHIKRCEEFYNKYPFLFRLFEIWARG